MAETKRKLLKHCFCCGKKSADNKKVDENLQLAFNDWLGNGNPEIAPLTKPLTMRKCMCADCSESVLKIKKFKEMCCQSLDDHDASIRNIIEGKPPQTITKYKLVPVDSTAASTNQEILPSEEVTSSGGLQDPPQEVSSSEGEAVTPNDETKDADRGSDDENGWWDSHNQAQNPEQEIDVELPEEYNCPECSNSFESQLLFRKHYNLVHSNFRSLKGIWCNLCDVDFKSGHYKKHVLDVHYETLPGNQLKCKVCEKVVKQHLHRDHFFKHRDYKEPRKCIICPNKYFINVAKFMRHMLGCHTNGRRVGSLRSNDLLTCKICKTFQTRTPSHYNTHVRIGHFGDKYCRYCQKPIPSKEWEAHLKYEINKHEIVKEHDPLSELGQKTIKECKLCYRLISIEHSKYNFLRHMKDHSCEGEFKCEICGNVYGLRSKLKKHLLIVHSRRYECDLCGFISNTIDKLDYHMIREHIRRTTDPNFGMVKCQICEKRYTYRYIDEHILRHAITGNKVLKIGKPKKIPESEVVVLCEKSGVKYDAVKGLKNAIKK